MTANLANTSWNKDRNYNPFIILNSNHLPFVWIHLLEKAYIFADRTGTVGQINPGYSMIKNLLIRLIFQLDQLERKIGFTYHINVIT